MPELNPLQPYSSLTTVANNCRLFGGPHHFRGGLRDETARREALPFFHQFVHKAGNHVAFSSSHGFQPDARNFLRGFGRTEGAFRLIRHLPKFRVGSPRTKRANAHAKISNFFRESLGEQKIESLRRG